MKTAWPSAAAGLPAKSCLRGLLLLRDPRIKVRGRLRINAQQHLGVLRRRSTARIGQGKGLPVADRATSCSRGSESDPSCPQGAAPRNCGPCPPRTCVEISRRRMRRIADRNMQFVGRDDSQLRIAVFPPELMADHGHIQRIFRLRESPGCPESPVWWSETASPQSGWESPSTTTRSGCCRKSAPARDPNPPGDAGKRISAYNSSPATMRKMASVTASTSIERSKMECAGVAAGAKMLVGDCARSGSAKRDMPHTAPWKARLQPELPLRSSVVCRLGKRDKTV